MEIQTSRFGPIQIEADDILVFPAGLIGFEEFRHWVLLGDQENASVGWLQSLREADLALPVVSPRRFVSDYRVRLTRRQLEPLELADNDHAYVLNIVSQSGADLTLNLRAPIVMNLDRRIGRQMITNDEQPVQMLLELPSVRLRKSA